LSSTIDWGVESIMVIQDFDVLRKYDFHVHEMVFGWRKHEKLTCSYCMENKKSLYLKKWW